MVTLDLSATQANPDNSDEPLAIAFSRPAAACKFALMPTQLLVESADPILLLSDTVCKLSARNVHTFTPCKGLLTCAMRITVSCFSLGTACLCWHSSQNHGTGNHPPYRYSEDKATGADQLKFHWRVTALHASLRLSLAMHLHLFAKEPRHQAKQLHILLS